MFTDRDSTSTLGMWRRMDTCLTPSSQHPPSSAPEAPAVAPRLDVRPSGHCPTGSGSASIRDNADVRAARGTTPCEFRPDWAPKTSMRKSTYLHCEQRVGFGARQHQVLGELHHRPHDAPAAELARRTNRPRLVLFLAILFFHLAGWGLVRCDSRMNWRLPRACKTVYAHALKRHGIGSIKEQRVRDAYARTRRVYDTTVVCM